MQYKRTILGASFVALVLCGVYKVHEGSRTSVKFQAAQEAPRAETTSISGSVPPGTTSDSSRSTPAALRNFESPEDAEAAARKIDLAAAEAKRKANQAFLTAAGAQIEKVSVVEARLDSITMGLIAYREKFGRYPKGEAKEIAGALLGKLETPAILAWPPKELSPNGEFLDPWGTPISIRFNESEVELWSAGPNRSFGDADDLKK
ncbi:MAG TPA: hypothetical protein VGO11_10810 [Chthoniobacteraceae bacterium]|jgi:hypothetical protein|nr:hypothetical protein [Chthoniobacteraceae bacterium]